jgi:prepilin signal peptidase PulO-like enzyme (type II secretory pathway)
MNITSKRSVFSILAGTVIGLLVSIFLRPNCWGLLIGVSVAAYLAKVSSPKEGAVVGTIALAPIGLYLALQTAMSQGFADEPIHILGNVVGLLVVFLFICALGTLYGLVLGKLFQLIRNKGIIL